MFGLGLARLSSGLPQGHQRQYIPGGNAGTAVTIARMRDLVSQGKRDFRIRKLAISLLQGCEPKNYSCYAQRIFDYCQNQIKYVFDPNGVELVEEPWAIVEARGADCDSIVVLLASLLESVGLACEFVTIKADTIRPDEFSHVYLECKVPKAGWVSMDPTMHDKPFGWQPAPEFPRKRWTASNDPPEQRDTDLMAGIGMRVPYAEQTKGVMVGSDWNFRSEAALVTSTPEEIELDSLSKDELPMEISQREEEFLTVNALKEMRFPESVLLSNPVETVTVTEKKPFPWLLVGAVVLGFYLVSRK